MQSKSSINKNYISPSSSGFALIELIVSLIIVMIGFLGIMTLYADVIKNFTQSQIIEEARFALSSQIEVISEDIKNADNVQIISGTRIKIKKDGDEWIYSCRDNEGLVKNGEQSADFYSNTIKQLFENNDVYILEVQCDKFDCVQGLSPMGNEIRLRKNFYTLTAEFELTAPEVYPNFKKIYRFERSIFAQNTFSIYEENE